MTSGRSDEGVLERLGVDKVVNAYGPATILGGSILDDRINKAMARVSKEFVDMDQLLDKSGAYIARMLGVESAFVTSGAAASLALSAAGCMTGTDGAKVELLPDTSSFEKNEIVVQAGQRNTYDRCLQISGAKIVSVGIPYITYPSQLEAALTGKTAAVAYFTLGTAWPGLLKFDQVAKVAKAHSVPLIFDGCNDVLPTLTKVGEYFSRGADLIVLSGGKNLQGPNDTGIVCGKKELVEACRANAHPHMHGIGRAMKVSKEQIVGLVVALELYSRVDPDERYSEWIEKLDYIQGQLRGVPNVELKRQPAAKDVSNVPVLEVTLLGGRGASGVSDVVRALKSHDPPVILDIGYWEKFTENKLVVDPSCLREGEERVVASALKKALTDKKFLRDLLSKKQKVNAVAYP